jgi:hypothetical protein
LRRFIVLGLLLAALAFGWLKWRESAQEQPASLSPPTITKQPVVLATRTFDPAAPPADMPPLKTGEGAECDSNFLSNASVSGEPRQTDSTHATVTVTHVKMTLQLHIAIWMPTGATPHVIDHEDGHRQISEFYYRTAANLAAQIAATYIGKQVEITGPNLNSEFNNTLQKLAAEITAEYGKQLNPEQTQLFYDALTDHSRNTVPVNDAVATALKDFKLASAQLPAAPLN